MKISKREKILVSISVVFGLLLIFQAQPVSAGSELPNGRQHLVDGGEIHEEAPTLQDEVNFSSLNVPFGKLITNTAAALPDIRIMPLGDSITKGTGTCSPPDTYLNCIGYRQDLWESLETNGYPTNFVGSQGSAFQPQYTYDNDHEGHGGFTTTDIKNNIYGSGLNWLQNNPADIILLHIGTNDFSGSPPYDPNLAASRVSQILDKVDDYENAEGKVVFVILAKIIKRYETAEQTTAVVNFNNALQSMANLRIAGGENLIVVDMETALSYPGDFLPDMLHPNSFGYSKMAAVWYPAIVDALNFPPTLSNPGAQSSVQGQNISVQMQATDPENDTLTYAGTGLPTGLSINSLTGKISGKISSSIASGTVFQVTITADDETGFPYSDPYNKDQVTFTWKIGEHIVLPLVIKH